MYREQIDHYIDTHKEAMIEDLKTLLRIDSQKSEAKEGMPYGEGPAKAIAAAQDMLEKAGFVTRNYENHVVTADFSDKEKQLDILAHLDVVPVTDDWTVTKPFEPLVVGDRIYGRGTSDDKGPAIAAFYAMKAIKDLGIPLKKNVRLILGADEECGSSDLKYYYGIEEEAPMTFTPDASFPVINIEKGRLSKEWTAVFEKSEALPKIVSIAGGDKANVVPGRASAVVEGFDFKLVEEKAKQAEKTTGAVFTLEEENGKIKINCKGSAAHASAPEGGINAVTALITMLVSLPAADSEGFEKLQAVAKLFPHNDHQGEALGVCMEDEISGKITVCFSVFHYDETSLRGEFDSRAPICANDENLTEVIRDKFAAEGITMEPGKMTPPHHVPGDSEFVKTLLESYERYTGIKGKPLAIGGGTYVHDLKRGVAFGCEDPAVDNHMHGDDEFMILDVLFMSAKIFADAIIKLCGEE
ncbi:MAG: Sapep family Mn(2+)-dependent dipeptidase [Lachnospiraceae bacterium]|nr:Sapep family Mn(2+)-dependent dipeptidase [Lachnospiraceae bacterium]